MYEPSRFLTKTIGEDHGEAKGSQPVKTFFNRISVRYNLMFYQMRTTKYSTIVIF